MFDFLSNKFSDVFSRLTRQKTLTEHNIQDTLKKVEQALIEADVPLQVVKDFLKEISGAVVGKKILKSLNPAEQFIQLVHEQLTAFLGGTAKQNFTIKAPATVMLMGLQGSGKTTTIIKLAHYLKDKHNFSKILVASVDYYRPAAITQLKVLAQSHTIDFYQAKAQDPLKAAQEISVYARANHYQLLCLDTAGRLHVDDTLLHELTQLNTFIKPTHRFLVLDAMTGQESLPVAQAFDKAVGFDYAILTKMDSQTRAGAAFAFNYVLKKSILFLGTGEKYDDFELCRPERMATRILGMGDIQTLMDRADEKIKQLDQEEIAKSLTSGKFTLNDFAKQLEMMNKLGSLSQLMRYMPGVGTVSPEMIQQGEQDLKRFKAIISSMTFKERINYKILNNSRKQRIAQGAGVAVGDIDALINRFEKSMQFVKLFNKFGGSKGL